MQTGGGLVRRDEADARCVASPRVSLHRCEKAAFGIGDATHSSARSVFLLAPACLVSPLSCLRFLIAALPGAAPPSRPQVRAALRGPVRGC